MKSHPSGHAEGEHQEPQIISSGDVTAVSDSACLNADGYEIADLLRQMSRVLFELAEETITLQSTVAPLFENQEGAEKSLILELQKLDRHAQYLVDLSRMSGGVSAYVGDKPISASALCRLVRLPSLREKLMKSEGEIDEPSESGSVAIF